MPEPGVTDRNFTRPTTEPLRCPVGPRPGGRRRQRLQIPREYANFQLEDGRQAIDVLGEEFFVPDTNSTAFEGPSRFRRRSAGADSTSRDGATVSTLPDSTGGDASKQGFGSQALRWKDKVQGRLAGANLLADVYEGDLRDMADRGMDPALSAPPNLREQGQLSPSTYRAGKYSAASPGEKAAMTRELEDRFARHLGSLLGAYQRLAATDEIPDPMENFKGALGRGTSEGLELVGVGLMGQLPGLSYVLGIPEGVIIRALEEHGIDPSDPDTNLRDAGVLVSNSKFRDAVLANFPFGRAPEGKTVGEVVGKTGENSIGPIIKDQIKSELIKRIIE